MKRRIKNQVKPISIIVNKEVINEVKEVINEVKELNNNKKSNIMKINIIDHNSFESLIKIDEPTVSQILGYMGSEVIAIDGKGYLIKASTMDHDTQSIIIHVSKRRS
jgi:hypothetical protein